MQHNIAPPKDVQAIDHSSSDVDITGPSHCLWVSATGAVAVDVKGTKRVFSAVPVGWFEIQATKVYSTANGTTATVEFAGLYA